MSEPFEVEQPGLREFSRLPVADQPNPSGLREYALVLWGRKLIILIVAAICVGATLAYCVAVTPTYQATASVLLEPPISQTLIQANFPTGAAPIPNVPDGIQVIESANVADLVAKTIPTPPSVSATQVGTTDVVQVAVRSKNAHLAAAAANAYARAYIKYERRQTVDTFTQAQSQLQTKVDTVQLAISQLNGEIRGAAAGANTAPQETQLGNLENQLTTLQDQLQTYQFYATQGTATESGQLISTATVPTKPVSPKTLEWTVLALIFGLILGVGVALLVNAVSPRP